MPGPRLGAGGQWLLSGGGEGWLNVARAAGGQKAEQLRTRPQEQAGGVDADHMSQGANPPTSWSIVPSDFIYKTTAFTKIKLFKNLKTVIQSLKL